MKTDVSEHITHLFFASRRSLARYEGYPEVVLLDCTYITHRFCMPLLNIIGITDLNTSFYIAFAFIKSEQEDFTWMLR